MKTELPTERHLAEGDFFSLAFPPAGEPEGLPPHLSACDLCRRRFSEWERAAREIVGRPVLRAPDFEREVMAKVLRLQKPRSRRAVRRWSAGIAAAACLIASFWLGTRMSPRRAEPPSPSAMSARDRADDALLRDVSRLVEDDDGSGWKSLVPLPAEGGNS
jgi:hypothetical protein